MTTLTPFHPGEQEIQTRLGVREQAEKIGQKFVRDYLPDQHREFYAQLPFFLIGSIDDKGRPWASVLVGRPGFVQSPDSRHLSIDTELIHGDPLIKNLMLGAPVGLLGIDYQSRRRNRATGKLSRLLQRGFEVEIDQTFGNCPRYIQSRSFELLPGIDAIGARKPVQSLTQLDRRQQRLISQADHFFIATHYSQDPLKPSHGTDVSHRGGRPGFVRVEDQRILTFPEFAGNNHFNTLGNILKNPWVGLLFFDFTSGNLLYLSGTAQIIWDTEEINAFHGAERLVRFQLAEGLLIEQAMPIRWNFEDFSPNLENTGSWEQVRERINARKQGNVYRTYQVVKIETESETIKSFYLEPEGGGRVPCHRAGQFLPIEIQPQGIDRPLSRTYTISNAPNGQFYRLTIKKEPPASPDLPAGLVSNYLHDQFETGRRIHAMCPRGKFTLENSANRPLVLISAGVGITPLMSMLEQLDGDREGCGCNRQIWFIHGARNSKTQAFGGTLKSLAQNWPCLHLHVRFSNPLSDDVQGVDYDSVGRIDFDWIKSLLPLDDYEYYFCGPPGFMQSIQTGLASLNIADRRIHYEFFGPGPALSRADKTTVPFSTEVSTERAAVPVEFSASGVKTVWDPSKGTLLELAEAEGLRPAFICRSGVCHACATPIVRGGVDYVERPMTPPDAGLALICCAYPQADSAREDDPEPLVLDL